MILIDTTIKPFPTSTLGVATFLYHPVPIPREPIVEVTPNWSSTVSWGKAVFSEEEALAILFPTPDSKLAFREALEKQHDHIKERILRRELSAIRGWRMIREMDQKQLSEATGIRQPNLSRMERLGANPSNANLQKIAKALNINWKELLP